jgi:hypothetical protein
MRNTPFIFLVIAIIVLAFAFNAALMWFLMWIGFSPVVVAGIIGAAHSASFLMKDERRK